MTRQRVDKWLWHARMVRTRSDAAALVAAGYVRLNGKRINGAGQTVAAGDVLTVALDRSVRLVQVESFCERRGASAAARVLYRELTTRSVSRASDARGDSRKTASPKSPD